MPDQVITTTNLSRRFGDFYAVRDLTLSVERASIFGMLGFSLWGLIDAARRPNEMFSAAGHSKGLWIALQFLLVPIGTLLYVIIAWPSLRRQAP